MQSRQCTVLNPSGFHARPTKMFVEAANTFPCKVSLVKGEKRVNGKSSLSILTLGISNRSQITLEVEGEQEEEALKRLGDLLEKIYEE